MLNSGAIVAIVLFNVIAYVIVSTLNFYLKKRLIDSGLADTNLIKNFLKPLGNSLESLKWALLFFFGGIGFVVIEYMPYNDTFSLLPYGVEAIFLSMGFITYYFIARRENP